jgi:hypothetical protein
VEIFAINFTSYSLSFLPIPFTLLVFRRWCWYVAFEKRPFDEEAGFSAAACMIE